MCIFQIQDVALLFSSGSQSHHHQQQGGHHSIPGAGAGSGPGPPGTTERSGSSSVGGSGTIVASRVRAHLLLGAACYQLGQYGEAIAAYDAAILEAPGLVGATTEVYVGQHNVCDERGGWRGE
jgi:hypothetical protein